MRQKESIVEYLNTHQNKLYELLSSLIKIDTQNFISYGNEKAGQEYLLEYLRESGIDCEMYYPDDVPSILSHEGYLGNRGTDRRPNLTAFIKGKNSGRKITLAAHMDTMPLGNEADWSVPPLSGAIKDGRIWGRGSSDNKAGIAASVFAAKALKDSGVLPEYDVYITSYADEEYGGGNGALASCLKYPSDVYINLDGGGMEVWPYGIGGGGCIAKIHSPVKASTTTGVFNGISVLVKHLEDFGKRRFEELNESPIFKDTVIQADAFRMLEISCGQNGVDLENGRVMFSYYTLSDYDIINKELSDLSARVQEEIFRYGLIFEGIERITRFFNPVNPDKISDDAAVFAKILGEFKKSPAKIAGGCLSDLAVFSQYGGGTAFNTGLYRGFGEYGGPHQADEYVNCNELLALTCSIAVYLITKIEEVAK